MSDDFTPTSQQASFKLLQCNIEGSKHLERLIPFLKAQAAEVVCLQEVFAVDVDLLSEELGMSAYFVPLLDAQAPNSFTRDPKGLWGLAILTKLPVMASHHQYYVGTGEFIPPIDEQNHNCLNRAVAWVDVMKQGVSYRMATTHFTWSPAGSFTQLQAENLVGLTQVLQTEVKEFVLCGDFNAPRGGEVYHRLTEWLTDYIPPHITTSIDKQWHRAGDLQLMVDYVFATNDYQATQVKLHDNVSDHMAVTALISKRTETSSVAVS